MRHDSLEYVSIPITSPVDISTDTVQVSFVVDKSITPVTWHTAAVAAGVAKILVGPGGVVQLKPRTWFVVVRVTDSPEIPVIDAGSITIT